jgi:hypothetical protein
MLSKISKHPSLIHTEDVKTICQPLEKLNINYFAHVHMDKSNQFSTLINNLAYAEYYLR